MQLRPATAGALAVLSIIVLMLPCATEAHNITRILGKFPEFSTFNHYLTVTHLAADINHRETVTVLAVDNSAMSNLLSKGYSIYSLKRILQFQVLLDYYGAKKLHQITNGTALSATMFQASGSAPGSSGFVNITDLRGGKVGFGAKDNGGTVDATFVKSVEEIPYNISIIQISKILPSPEAEAPTPGPSQTNITALMSAHGCKVFAEALLASAAEATYQSSIDGGLTIFCPGDDSFKKFLPKFKNLTDAQKEALLECHGIPLYQPLSTLRSSNGVQNTLATDGANKYDLEVKNDGEDVTLKTKVVTARITGTLFDEQPLAIFTLDKVLLPIELFKAALSPSPAPAPAPETAADAPKPSKKHKSPLAPAAPADAPADGPDGDPADQTANDNGAGGFRGWRIVTAALSIWLVLLLF